MCKNVKTTNNKMVVTEVVVTDTLLLHHLPISFRFQEHHQNHSHAHTLQQ